VVIKKVIKNFSREGKKFVMWATVLRHYVICIGIY